MESVNIPYNIKIDQLRWLAALIVFLFHFYREYLDAGGAPATSAWLGLITEGHTGVGLFFTLSGFLFMQIAIYQKVIDYKEFIRNRFLRIFPLYLVFFLVATSIGRDKFLPQDILYIVTSNLGSAPTSASAITGAAWCISLEFSFYLVFPFLARFALDDGAGYLCKILILLLFFKVCAFTINPHSNLMYFSTFVGRFDQFLIGMLAAILYPRQAARLRRFSPFLLVLAAVAMVVITGLQSAYAPYLPQEKSRLWIGWSMIESTGWGFFIVAWLAFTRILPSWLNQFMRVGGKISYSFYLFHMAVIHLLFNWFGLAAITGHPWLDILIDGTVLYGVTWVLATLSFATIEQPFLRLRRRYGSSSISSSTASGTMSPTP